MRILARHRIGPHNIDILSIIYGTLLGDSQLEKRHSNVRISFQQENINVEYLHWLWKQLSENGYCSSVRPQLRSRIGLKGKKIYFYRLNTYTYSSFNFLWDDFYWDNSLKKRVPLNISSYLTPLALACWIMDDGGRVGKGVKIATNNFIYEDLLLLINCLQFNFNIKSKIHKTGVVNQWCLYIPSSEISKLQAIVGPYIVPSMRYKIHLS